MKYEYKTWCQDINYWGTEHKYDKMRNGAKTQLAKLGNKGWELVSVVPIGQLIWFFFKREKEDKDGSGDS